MWEKSLINTLIKPNLHRKNTLSKAAVIVTSRPISSGDLCPLVSSRIEVIGFTAEEQRLFFTECLSNDTKAVETLMDRLSSNPAMEGSCYLPLNASIVAHLYLANGSLPSTIYGIFSSLVQHYLSRYLYERQGVSLELANFESLEGLPHQLNMSFTQLCKVTFKGAMDNKLKVTSTVILKLQELQKIFVSLVCCRLYLVLFSRGRSAYHNFLRFIFYVSFLYLPDSLTNRDIHVIQFRSSTCKIVEIHTPLYYGFWLASSITISKFSQILSIKLQLQILEKKHK